MTIVPNNYCPHCGFAQGPDINNPIGMHTDACPNHPSKRQRAQEFAEIMSQDREPRETCTVDSDVLAKYTSLAPHVGHTVGLYNSGAVYCYQCQRWAVDVSPADGPGPVEEREEFHRITPGQPVQDSETAGTEISTYVDKAMYDAAPMQSLMPKVHLVSATPDPLGAIAAACRMYEGKPTYNLSEVTDDERRQAWQQVQDTHLKAPLEFVDLHFFIEGVTRAFTHQMVRQRTAVYAQESLRFAVKDEIAARPGPIISQDRNARGIWETAIRSTWDSYKWLIANGVPAEEARGLLPHDTLTRLNYKTNLRNLLEHAGNRLCTQAQFEWRMVFLGIVKAIRDRTMEPVDMRFERVPGWQWKHIAESNVFKPVCFSLGHCPFNADFDRGCTIRERVEEGNFDDIRPEEYMADPTAGWVR